MEQHAHNFQCFGISELDAVVKQHIFHFGLYDFLWKDDMLGDYEEFIQHNRELFAIEREVDRLLKIEQKVCSVLLFQFSTGGG